MIDAPTPAPEPARRRRWWLTTLIVLAVLLAGGVLIPLLTAPSSSASAPQATLPVQWSTLPTLEPSVSPSPSVSETGLPDDLLKLPGAVPTHGSGTFDYAPGRSAVLGTKGALKHFRVAVEKGGDEDAAEFAAQVVATLGDARSWVGGGQFRLQRVPGSVPADFTVYLATRETAGRMCAAGGVRIIVDGRPYTSCRATGKAIINLDRWRLSSTPYLAAKVPLAVYRQYVINHEVGHEFGHHHEGCPKQGGPAPVMVQQTLILRGCVPYAWPRRAGHLFSGPGL